MSKATKRANAKTLPEENIPAAKSPRVMPEKAKETRMTSLLGELRGMMRVRELLETEAQKPESGDGGATSDDLSGLTDAVWKEIVSLQPTSLTALGAFAEGLKIDACSHHWREPKEDRNWDIYLFTELVDLLIAFAPGQPRVA